MSNKIILEPKTNEEIVDDLITDTIMDKLSWRSRSQYIFTELKLGEGIYLVFKITDTLEEEEEEDEDIEYLSRYAEYYNTTARYINLNVYLKKDSVPNDIFIRKVAVSQTMLMDLLEVVSPRLKK